MLKRKEVAIKDRHVDCAFIYYCNFCFVVKDKDDFLNAFCAATSKSACRSSLNCDIVFIILKVCVCLILSIGQDVGVWYVPLLDQTPIV